MTMGTVSDAALAEITNYLAQIKIELEVFSSGSKSGLYESYLLFSEGGCHLIFRQESWSKSEVKFELKKLIAAARHFSVM